MENHRRKNPDLEFSLDLLPLVSGGDRQDIFHPLLGQDARLIYTDRGGITRRSNPEPQQQIDRKCQLRNRVRGSRGDGAHRSRRRKEAHSSGRRRIRQRTTWRQEPCSAELQQSSTPRRHAWAPIARSRRGSGAGPAASATSSPSS